MVKRKCYTVQLLGLNDRAKKIIDYYHNQLLVIEYDQMGRSLNLSPSGEQGIFCMSPDGFWHGWFVLDKDVRFKPEMDGLMKTLSDIDGEDGS